MNPSLTCTVQFELYVFMNIGKYQHIFILCIVLYKITTVVVIKTSRKICAESFRFNRLNNRDLARIASCGTPQVLIWPIWQLFITSTPIALIYLKLFFVGCLFSDFARLYDQQTVETDIVEGKLIDKSIRKRQYFEPVPYYTTQNLNRRHA